MILLLCALCATFALAETAPSPPETAPAVPSDAGPAVPSDVGPQTKAAEAGPADSGISADAVLPYVPVELTASKRWIFIDKSDRVMVVNDGQYREAFPVALGFSPVGDKEIEGDGRTPEGNFYVCQRSVANRFHRFLGLSYPSPADAQRGQAAGILSPLEIRTILRAFRLRGRPPWNTPLGGNVGIHGWGHRTEIAAVHGTQDWTDGCIGVTNDQVERIYGHAPLGTPVTIVP